MHANLDADDDGRRRDGISLAHVGATVVSGALFVLAFPQYGDAWGLDWLVWLCLTPFFYVATSSGPRAGALLGFCLGMVIEGAGFVWIYHAIASFTDGPALLSAVLFCVLLLYAAIVWTLLGLALGCCRSLPGLFWVLPLWVGLEDYFPRLWPWHFGGALYSREWLLQCVDLFGASGLTALVFLANGVLALLWGYCARRNAFPLAAGLVLTVLVVGANVYGAVRLERVRSFEATRRPLAVMLVQGALDIEQRHTSGLEIYKARTAAARQADGVDLVVWPEGAISEEGKAAFNLSPGGDPWYYFKRFGLEPLAPDVPLVAGGAGVVWERRPRESNISVYLVPGEKPRIYEKMIRVPFGEVVPGLDLLPAAWIDAWGLRVGNIAAGKENPAFFLQDIPFKNLSCYEAILPDYWREHAPGAEFYVNITEDIWYGRTAHIPQHVSVLILRAVENRLPVIRCCNMGPSGVVGISGRFDRGEKIFEPEVLFKECRPGRMWTLHQAGGYLFSAAMLLVAFFRFGITMRRRPRFLSGR